MMARYIGTEDLGSYLAASIGGRWIQLPTDEGSFKIKVTDVTGNVVSARTDDNKLVTIDLKDPDHITIT